MAIKQISELNNTVSNINNTYFVADENDGGYKTRKISYSDLASKIKDSIKQEIFNDYYPVGSIYITTANSCPLPGNWEQVATGRCLWGAGSSYNPGQEIAQALPLPQLTATIEEAGEHKHSYNKVKFHSPQTSKHSGQTSYHPDNLDDVPCTTDETGKHTHPFSVGAQADGVYSSSQTIVQPPAYTVNIFKRTS